MISRGYRGDPFVLGVKHGPRRKAMYWWSDFDAAEVADEFIRRFADTGPTVATPSRVVELDVSPPEYHEDPEPHARRLYEVSVADNP